VRRTGIPAAISRDAGAYLCNYVCWRATEAAERDGAPRLVAFVHVPDPRRPHRCGEPASAATSSPSITFADSSARRAIVLADWRRHRCGLTG